MKALIDYAMSWVGRPYIWGGSGPDGFDCSGFVLELLMGVGASPPHDMTAQGIYSYYKDKGLLQSHPSVGSLVFYGMSVNSISHIGMALDGFRLIEAGGGTSRTKTPEDAVRDCAFVRIRPIYDRDDYLVAIMPHYEGLSV